MKNITIFIILGLFLISMTTIQTLTSRSKEQVVLHSTDVNSLTNSINKYYSLGYRATLGVGQGISNRATIDAAYADGQQITKGEILVIILISFTLNDTVIGFINPEYGAIKDIINFVSNTSKTCSTCN